jgi:ribosomal protein L11 methyltransferase
MTDQPSTAATGGQPAAADWPLLRLDLPAAPADADETAGRLVQAAVDTGALGAWHEPGVLVICLPRTPDPVAQAATLAAIERALAIEAAALGGAFAPPRADTLQDAPWATAWKDRFHPLPVGRRLLIRPDWEIGQPTPAPWADRLTLWIRPGLGFGTGHHETTRMALCALEETLTPGDDALDFGTGSAVLAIASVRLGAGRVCAADKDPQALVNARENLELNDLSARVELLEASVPGAFDGTFSLMVCNMLPQFALPLLPDLARRLRGKQSRLIYTGYLADQVNEVDRVLGQSGLRPVHRRIEGEWGGVIAVPA